MYWSDWGSSPKIEQANMDGSNRKTLVNSGLVWVNSLALDYKNRLLYWCDASLDKIERIDLQGNNRKLILDLSLGNMHPFGLAVSDDILYWTDWNSNSVHKFNMTSSHTDVVVHGMEQPMELHIHGNTAIFNGMHVPTSLISKKRVPRSQYHISGVSKRLTSDISFPCSNQKHISKKEIYSS